MNKSELSVKLAKGTAVNLLGAAAKALYPAFLIIITHLYGPSIVGVFLLSNTITELCISFTFSGFQEGVLLFSSRHFGQSSERKIVYQVLANAVVIIFVLTSLALILTFTVLPAFIEAKYDSEGLINAVKIMVFSLPFLAIPQIVVAATKSLMIMKYDAILLGGLKPGLLVLAAIAIYFTDRSIEGLAMAYLVSNIAVSLVAVFVYRHYFSFGELVACLRRFKLYRPLLVFSIPQNLNLTLVYFMSGISILMLGASHISKEMIAFYGTSAEILRHIKQVRIAFSSVFAPVVSRLHNAGQLGELSDHYTTLTRWITTLVFPVIFIVLSFKEQLLIVFHASYVHDSLFMVPLAVSAFLGCAFGLSGNIIAMTGRSTLNLINSLVVGALSFGLNWLLIPRAGLLGAALATVIVTFASVTIKTIQIYLLYRIHLTLRPIYKPYIAGIVAALGFWLLDTIGLNEPIRPFVLCIGSLSLYGGVWLLLGLEKRDIKVLSQLWDINGAKEKDVP
ncbi:MAG: hypothetical protein GY762_18845 [Proteobacteria bacterium]|nr:hypothetical protein [Pseudomonadota bacterium]